MIKTYKITPDQSSSSMPKSIFSDIFWRVVCGFLTDSHCEEYVEDEDPMSCPKCELVWDEVDIQCCCLLVYPEDLLKLHEFIRLVGYYYVNFLF